MEKITFLAFKEWIRLGGEQKHKTTCLKFLILQHKEHTWQAYLDSICSCFEVGLTVDGLTILDRPKKNDPGQGVAGDEEEHAHDDEEALVHADEDGLHQHLEGGMLARYGEEPQDDDNIAKRQSVLESIFVQS